MSLLYKLHDVTFSGGPGTARHSLRRDISVPKYVTF